MHVHGEVQESGGDFGGLRMKCPADLVLACDKNPECRCGFCMEHCVCEYYEVGDGAGCNCPWCGKRLDYYSDPLGDSEELEDECGNCGKPIIWMGNIHHYYSISKGKSVEKDHNAVSIEEPGRSNADDEGLSGNRSRDPDSVRKHSVAQDDSAASQASDEANHA